MYIYEDYIVKYTMYYTVPCTFIVLYMCTLHMHIT